MTKTLLPRRLRLGTKLAISALISAAAAVAVYLLLDLALYTWLDGVVYSEAFDEKQRAAYTREFESFAPSASLTDSAALDKFTRARPDFELILVRGGLVVYDSLGIFTGSGSEYFDGTGVVLTDVAMADGSAQYALFGGFYDGCFRIADIASGAAAAVMFLALFLLFIRRKLRYIGLLESELRILEGGELGYSVTIRSGDELGDLAQGIDDMRKSIIERQRREGEAVDANRRLIRSLSHDLRTPMTSLVGYLELIRAECDGGRRQPELSRYAERALDCAGRLRRMTDDLFRCSDAGDESEQAFVGVRQDAMELFDQLLTEHIMELEDRGFTFVRDTPEFRAEVYAEADRLARVFDNIFANLSKYAELTRPVAARWSAGGGFLTVSVSNDVAAVPRDAESHGIGIASSRRILERHGGSLSSELSGGEYTVTLKLPIV